MLFLCGYASLYLNIQNRTIVFGEIITEWEGFYFHVYHSALVGPDRLIGFFPLAEKPAF